MKHKFNAALAIVLCLGPADGQLRHTRHGQRL